MNMDNIIQNNKTQTQTQTQWESLLKNDKEIAEIIIQILDSARKITCSYNYQERPWQVILATSKESHFPILFGCLDLFNQRCHSNAEVLGVILEKKYFDESGEEICSKFYDSEIFMTALKLEGEKFNCSIHQMFGFSKELITGHFDITFNFEPKLMFTIGNPNLNIQTWNLNYLRQNNLLMRENVEFNEI